MKYKDLPSLELIEKLKAILTGDPRKDNKLFFYCLSVEPLATYLEAQRVKLVERYGEPDGSGYRVTEENLEKFREEYDQVLEMDVEKEVSPFPIPPDLSWFDDPGCVYPKNQKLWLDFRDRKVMVNLAKKEEKQRL